MSSPSKLLIAALVLAVSAPSALVVSAPAAMADPLAYDPYDPGHHPGPPAYYNRYRVLAPDWFERRDTITLQAGDAVAANQAIMMRDPWPPYVNNRNLFFNGAVIDSAIDLSEAGEVVEPEAVAPAVGE